MKKSIFPEFAIEDGKPVDLTELVAKPMIPEMYSTAHRSLPIVCHDAFLNYQNGILLVERKEHPAKGEIWPIGGRLKRGMSVESSLALKVKEETNLQITSPQLLGVCRHYWRTDPFGHGRGCDTPVFVFFADAHGKLDLSAEHGRPYIVMPANSPPPKKLPEFGAVQLYTRQFKKELHPYVTYYMPLALRKLSR